MRMDVMNKWLNVKTPAEVFTSCPHCRSKSLFDFEGEIFCNGCNWDSIEVHAEILAVAQINRNKPERELIQVSASNDKNSPYFGKFYYAFMPKTKTVKSNLKL